MVGQADVRPAGEAGATTAAAAAAAHEPSPPAAAAAAATTAAAAAPPATAGIRAGSPSPSAPQRTSELGAEKGPGSLPSPGSARTRKR